MEDPFQDYRYEDPFNIADPFADETDDPNANKSSGADKTDPFGFRTVPTFSSKTVTAKSFDSDFSNTFPLAKGKVERGGTNKATIDFEKTLSSNNRNVRNIEADFSQTFANVKTKTTDLDEAFSTKSTKNIIKHESDVGRTSKSNIIYNEKFANDFDKMWNGNNVANLSEEEQLAWAEKQSVKTEEERVKRKEKEDAELALAIALSRRGKSGNV